MKKFFVLSLFLSLCLPAFADTAATAILIDISKSIPPGDIAKAKDLAANIAQNAGPSDSVVIYSFGNELKKVSLQELKTLEPVESYTMLFDAAYDVARDLKETKADRKAMIIVSDGLDTKSATILEDTVHFANAQGIVLYGIGAGKADRKSLERIARLTGGKYFAIDTPDLVAQLHEVESQQAAVAAPSQPQANPEPVQPEQQKPVSQPSSSPAPANIPAQEEQPHSSSYMWIAAIAGGLILFGVVGWVIARALRSEKRTCPTCDRVLEPYQTLCPECSGPGKRHDKTVEIVKGLEEEEDPIPIELLERRPVTEEMLTKTFVLMETPMLVIRKGRNIGQSFSLNRVYPVSIGRSRVNEIKLEDTTVSGQHCRIIPENGKHVLYDMTSTNGTFLNEKRVKKATLKEGDIIKIGETQFLFKVEQQRN